MPQFFNNALDDEPQPDGCLSFEGGMFSNAKPRMLKPNQAVVLRDAEVSVTGEVTNRRGSVQVGGGVPFTSGPGVIGTGYYKTNSNSYELAATDSGVYRLNGSTWTQLGTQTFGSGQVDLFQGGQGGASSGVSVEDDKLYACGSATDIYRWNGTTWTNTSSPETTASAPRQVSILCWHTGRLVAAGASIKARTADTPAPDALYFSDILDSSVWGTTTYDTQIRIGGGDGSAVVSIVSWNDFRLAVFKRNSCWVVDADPGLAPSDMPIQRVHGEVGCVAKRSAVQVGKDILFLADDGVRSLQQTIASDQQHELGVPLSFPIQDFISRINWVNSANACATFWNNLYLLAVPLDTSTTNNFVFVFNSITSTWSGYWTGLPVRSFGVRKGSNQLSLIMGLHTTNKVVEYLDYVQEEDATDDTYKDWSGNSTQLFTITRSLVFNDYRAFKKGLDYDIEWNNSKGAIDIVPILDDTPLATDTMQLASGGFPIPFTLPFLISRTGTQHQPFDLMRHPAFREMQLRITTSGAGRKSLRQIVAMAFIENAGPLIPGTGQTTQGATQDVPSLAL